jgi:hypothetical protein
MDVREGILLEYLEISELPRFEAAKIAGMPDRRSTDDGRRPKYFVGRHPSARVEPHLPVQAEPRKFAMIPYSHAAALRCDASGTSDERE